MTTVIEISRKRGDTKRMVFRIKDSDTGDAVDISSWTDFFLTINPGLTPEDDTGNVEQIAGVIVDGPQGRVRFTPSGDSEPGNYFYDAQALDDNGEKVTFVQGEFEITQDITKN